MGGARTGAGVVGGVRIGAGVVSCIGAGVVGISAEVVNGAGVFVGARVTEMQKRSTNKIKNSTWAPCTIQTKECFFSSCITNSWLLVD